jgi:hypothetical protein
LSGSAELLDGFFLSLRKLKSFEKPDQSVFDTAVQSVVSYGGALQTMAGGVAIQRHLQVIEDELTISHHERANQIAILDVETKQEHLDDVELRNVQPFSIRDGNAPPCRRPPKTG